MLKTNSKSVASIVLNLLPVWLLIALTGLDFLSHIPLGGNYSNRSADVNLWRSDHTITNAVFYVIGIWAIAKLILTLKNLKSLLNPIMLCFLVYCTVVALSLIFNWPFQLPGWDSNQSYPKTMVIRLFAFFFAIAAIHGSFQNLPARFSFQTLVKNLWNIILGFFAIRLCLVWIQSFMLKFPSNPANPSTETQAFVTKQLELLFDGRLFYPIRAQGLDFPFLYGPLNANESAILAIILFCTALIRILCRRNKLSVFHLSIWSAIALLALLTIVFTHSSTAIILLVIVVPLIFTLNGRADVVAISLFLITTVALLYDEPIQNKVSDYLGRGQSVVERATDLGGRRYIWKKAFTHVKEKPIFGHGYETNRFVIGRALKDISPYNDPSVLHAHNTYVSVLVENGIVGLVPLLTGVLLLWNACLLRIRKLNYSSLSQEMLLLLLIISFSSLVYIGFFNSVLIIYRWLMLIPLLLFAMSPITSNFSENNSDKNTTLS